MKNKVVQLRLSDAMKEHFEQAANKDGLTFSDWLRLAGQEKLLKDKIVITDSSSSTRNVITKAKDKKADVITNPDSDFERFKRFSKTPYTQY